MGSLAIGCHYYWYKSKEANNTTSQFNRTAKCCGLPAQGYNARLFKKKFVAHVSKAR